MSAKHSKGRQKALPLAVGLMILMLMDRLGYVTAAAKSSFSKLAILTQARSKPGLGKSYPDDSWGGLRMATR